MIPDPSNPVDPIFAAPPGGGSRQPASGSVMILAFGVLFGAILAALLAWVYIAEKPEGITKHGTSRLAVRGQAPDFHLTDQDGKPVTRADMNGKVWIASFIFTRCGGACPIMSQNTSALQKSIKETGLADKVRLVSFTVDPDTDTQEVLSRYAGTYGADPKVWSFARGGYEETQNIAREGFKLAVLEGDATSTEPIIHSQSLVLMDREGRIRGSYDGTNGQEVVKAIGDIKKLLAEPEGKP